MRPAKFPFPNVLLFHLSSANLHTLYVNPAFRIVLGHCVDSPHNQVSSSVCRFVRTLRQKQRRQNRLYEWNVLGVINLLWKVNSSRQPIYYT